MAGIYATYPIVGSGGGGGGAVWGSITGTIGDQTDLQAEFATKWDIAGNTGFGLILKALTEGASVAMSTADHSTGDAGNFTIAAGNGAQSGGGHYGGSLGLNAGAGWNGSSVGPLGAYVSLQGGTPDYGGTLNMAGGGYGDLGGASIALVGSNGAQSGNVNISTGAGLSGASAALLQLSAVIDGTAGGSFSWTGGANASSTVGFTSGSFTASTVNDINLNAGNDIVFQASQIISYKDFSFLNQQGINLYDSGNTGFVQIKAPSSVSPSYTIFLPPAQGTGALNNDGSGNLSWGSAGGGQWLTAGNTGSSLVLGALDTGIGFTLSTANSSSGSAGSIAVTLGNAQNSGAASFGGSYSVTAGLGWDGFYQTGGSSLQLGGGEDDNSGTAILSAGGAYTFGNTAGIGGNLILSGGSNNNGIYSYMQIDGRAVSSGGDINFYPSDTSIVSFHNGGSSEIQSNMDFTFHTQHGINFFDGGSSFVSFKAPSTINTSYALLLPTDQGLGALTNDNSGNLSWVSYAPTDAPTFTGLVHFNNNVQLNSFLTTVLATDGDGNIISVPNSAGVLTNDGSGNLSWV